MANYEIIFVQYLSLSVYIPHKLWGIYYFFFLQSAGKTCRVIGEIWNTHDNLIVPI